MRVIKPDSSEFPHKLKDIHSPPKQLYYVGDIAKLNSTKVVSIVGSRAVTPYGRDVTFKFAFELAKRGVSIVSGLALGVDALAHKAALQAEGYTVAVLINDVENPKPATNGQLGRSVVENRGAIISENGKEPVSFKYGFVQRNRLVSGLADIVLVTEAGEKSGTLHTANFALEQGRTVMAVPGNITSVGSKGTNNLIKAGALPATTVDDVLQELGLADNEKRAQVMPANEQEKVVLDLLNSGLTDGSALLVRSGLSPVLFNQTLTMLEITGKVKPLGGGHWSVK